MLASKHDHPNYLPKRLFTIQSISISTANSTAPAIKLKSVLRLNGSSMGNRMSGGRGNVNPPERDTRSRGYDARKTDPKNCQNFALATVAGSCKLAPAKHIATTAGRLGP